MTTHIVVRIHHVVQLVENCATARYATQHIFAQIKIYLSATQAANVLPLA